MEHHHPDIVGDRVNIGLALQFVLQKSPNNLTALLYAAYYSYDQKNFEDACFYLKKVVSCSDYDKEFQRWCALKVRELLLAANIYLGFCGHVEIKRGLDQLLDDMESTDPVDVAVPEEITIMIARKREYFHEVFGERYIVAVGKRLRKIITMCSSENCLQDEITTICEVE